MGIILKLVLLVVKLALLTGIALGALLTGLLGG